VIWLRVTALRSRTPDSRWRRFLPELFSDGSVG